jgi:ADP-ribose pyrophosphatase
MKIPPHATRVFKDIIFDVYQWEREMFDGSTGTFEMLERKPTVDIIATKDDKVIILMQEQPTKPLFSSLVGGAIEEGETPEQAAQRELLEETGLRPGELILLEQYEGSYKIHFPEYLFVTRNCRKVAEPTPDAGERISVKPVGFDEFLQYCREERFSAPIRLRFAMYEALLDKEKKEALRQRIFP